MKNPHRQPPLNLLDWRYWAWTIAIVAAYVGTARLGLTFAFMQGNATPVWPPSGIALAALVLLGYRYWPAVSIGAFLATFFTGAPLPAVICVAAGNTLEAVAGAVLLRRAGFDAGLGRLKDVLSLVIYAALLSTLASATIGVTSLGLFSVMPWGSYAQTWWTWWLGDVLGDLTIAPVILSWSAAAAPEAFRGLLREPRRNGYVAEAAALFAMLLVVSFLVFEGILEVTYLTIPILVWAGLRFTPRIAGLSVLVLSTLAVWFTVHDFGFLVAGTANQSLLNVDTFIAAAALTSMVMAAISSERKAADLALRRSKEMLETRVAERTADLERELSERRRLEGAIEQERNFAESLVETARTVILVLDTRGRIVRFNRYLEEVSGHKLSDVKGSDWFSTFLPERDRDRIRDLFLRAVTEERTQGNVNSIMTKDGTERFIEWFDDTLRDPEGRVTGVLSVGQDITVRIRAEEERESLIRELQEALTRIKTLHGLIPICSNCKKIRDDSGYWRQIEAYISQHSEAEFSHSLCPECARALYPDLYQEDARAETDRTGGG